MATTKLTAVDVPVPGFQDDVDSYPLRTSLNNLKNAINGVVDDIAAASIGTTNAETTAARPYHTALLTRLDSIGKGQANYVKYGGVVSMNGATKVDVTATEGKVDAVDVKAAGATSAAISLAGAGETRYDVVVINSDSTLTIVTGASSTTPILPTVASTQKALWVLTISDAAVALGWDARDQGCWYAHDGCAKYAWYIQTAIDDITNGDIYIGKGQYYEEADLSAKSGITLIYANGAKHYRYDTTHYCVKSDNAGGSETTDTKIIGGKFYGNGQAGSKELLYMQYADRITILDCYFDGNASSTATYKNFVLDYCDRIQLSGNMPIASGVIDYTSTNLTNITELCEDGRFTGEVMMCGTTAQKAPMLKRGWTELTAMDDKVLRIDKDTAGNTGGADASKLDYGAITANIDGYNEHDRVYARTASTLDILKLATASGGSTIEIKDLKNTITTLPAYYTLIALIHR